MLICKSSLRTTWRKMKCFVVDYDRLLPNGWPRLTPVGDYQPLRTNPRRNPRRIDHTRALNLLAMGLTTSQIAQRMGCHRSTISDIRAAAALP